MPERTSRIHWGALCLTTGVLLILACVFQLNWIVVVFVTFLLDLFVPARDKTAEWSLWKKVLAFVGTLVAITGICLLIWMAGGSIDVAARAITVAVGIGLVLIGLGLFLH